MGAINNVTAGFLAGLFVLILVVLAKKSKLILDKEAKEAKPAEMYGNSPIDTYLLIDHNVHSGWDPGSFTIRRFNTLEAAMAMQGTLRKWTVNTAIVHCKGTQQKVLAWVAYTNNTWRYTKPVIRRVVKGFEQVFEVVVVDKEEGQ